MFLRRISFLVFLLPMLFAGFGLDVSTAQCLTPPCHVHVSFTWDGNTTVQEAWAQANAHASCTLYYLAPSGQEIVHSFAMPNPSRSFSITPLPGTSAVRVSCLLQTNNGSENLEASTEVLNHNYSISVVLLLTLVVLAPLACFARLALNAVLGRASLVDAVVFYFVEATKLILIYFLAPRIDYLPIFVLDPPLFLISLIILTQIPKPWRR